MQACVVAYPKLTPADQHWIEELRKRHDPHYQLIKPHWTLVFPTAGIPEGVLERHVGAVAATFAPFTFELRCALAVRDVFSPLTHLFLTPAAGVSQLMALHAALYTNVLTDRLRHDIPYIPHITIGAFATPHACKAVANRLNRQRFAMRGQIAELSIVAVEPDHVTLRQRIALAAPGA